MRRASSSGSMLPWLGLALILLIVDQFTKVLILGAYQLGESTTITGFFNIVRAHNTGAAFSFLAAASGWQRWLFTGIGLAATGFIVWMLRSHSGQKLFSFSLACILAGAIGCTATWSTSCSSTGTAGTSRPSTWRTARSPSALPA
jgi:signal peptidase II